MQLMHRWHGRPAGSLARRRSPAAHHIFLTGSGFSPPPFCHVTCHLTTFSRSRCDSICTYSTTERWSFPGEAKQPVNLAPTSPVLVHSSKVENITQDAQLLPAGKKATMHLLVARQNSRHVQKLMFPILNVYSYSGCCGPFPSVLFLTSELLEYNQSVLVTLQKRFTAGHPLFCLLFLLLLPKGEGSMEVFH